MEIIQTFQHYDLKLIQPDFDSELTNLVLHLEGLRSKLLRGSTKPWMFFQIKEIFHIMESLGSARIEGNNTTIAEIIESKIDDVDDRKPSIIEIENIMDAIEFIDENIDETEINEAFVRELHKKVVNELPPPPKGEGDNTPGQFRNCKVKIEKSPHLPPELQSQVIEYMGELIKFIQMDLEPKYDLIKTALVHHRFMWIHPFTNGNGRTGRLLTYAMLVKQGFNIKNGRLVNPTAIFCLDRDLYNANLSKADTGSKEGLNNWCEFVLSGLKSEIEKIDKLLDYKFFKGQIVLPALKIALERKLITDIEESILRWTISNKAQVVVNSDIKKNILKNKSTQSISNIIKRLVTKKMLRPFGDKPRTYYLSFENNYLLRAVIQVLGEKDFLPLKE